jgi:putative transcription factor
MEECELCGAPTKSVYIVNVEDVELRVCAKCAQGKKVITTHEYKPAVARKATRPRSEEEQSLVENYGKVIREARERMKLPIKVLAEMLNEKETLLARIEQQSTMPTMKLTKMLEKALSIKLIESAESPGAGSVTGGKKSNATLGEFINSK